MLFYRVIWCNSWQDSSWLVGRVHGISRQPACQLCCSGRSSLSRSASSRDHNIHRQQPDSWSTGIQWSVHTNQANSGTHNWSIAVEMESATTERKPTGCQVWHSVCCAVHYCRCSPAQSFHQFFVVWNNEQSYERLHTDSKLIAWTFTFQLWLLFDVMS